MPRRRGRHARLLTDYERALASGLGHEGAVAALRAAWPGLTPQDEHLLRMLAAPPAGLTTPFVGAPADLGGPPVALPGYEILGELGRGGMGVVYEARQAVPSRPVALKMVLASRALSPDAVTRFRLEAQVLAAFDDPHIVPVYEVGEHRGMPFFSMKLIDGGPLAASRLPDGGRGAEGRQRVAEVLAKVARAVHHAHERGVLHRDLKPGNILLDAQGEPHVTDFGLARDQARPGPTETGQLLGTPEYMPPELLRGARGLTVAADVWALGVILYEMLAGRTPFRGAGLEALFAEILSSDPPPLRTLAPDVGRDLETVCLKCLEKEPGRRYPSALALAEDLERWLAGEPVLARPVGWAEHAWRWCRRNALAASLLAAVAVLAVGVVVSVGVGAAFYRHQAKLAGDAREAADAEAGRAADAEHAARVDAGRDALARGNWDEALRHYDIAIGHGREDVTQLEVERLRCWFTYRDRPRLDAELKRLASGPLTARQKALVTLHRGDYLMSRADAVAEARRLVAEALTLPLPPADEGYARGLLADTAEAATRHFRAALAIDRFHHRANAGLACELLMSGRFEEARRAADFMRRIYARDPVAPFALAWCGLLEGDIAASRRHRADLPALLDAERHAQLEKFFAAMEKVVRTLLDWEAERIEAPAAILALTFAGAELAGMNAAALEPVGFGSPNVARVFRALDEVRQGMAFQELGFRELAIGHFKTAAATHPEGAIRLLLARAMGGRVLDAQRKGRHEEVFRHAADVRAVAYEAAAAPTLFPISPFRYQARLMAASMDAVEGDFHRYLLLGAVGTLGRFAASPSPAGLALLPYWKTRPLDAARPARLAAECRLLLAEGHRHPGARREGLPLLAEALPAPFARAMAQDWLADEPDAAAACALLARIERKAGDLTAALAHCRRGLARHPRDRELLRIEKEVATGAARSGP